MVLSFIVRILEVVWGDGIENSSDWAKLYPDIRFTIVSIVIGFLLSVSIRKKHCHLLILPMLLGLKLTL
jgi:hypothetical protein